MVFEKRYPHTSNTKILVCFPHFNVYVSWHLDYHMCYDTPLLRYKSCIFLFYTAKLYISTVNKDYTTLSLLLSGAPFALWKKKIDTSMILSLTKHCANKIWKTQLLYTRLTIKFLSKITTWILFTGPSFPLSSLCSFWKKGGWYLKLKKLLLLWIPMSKAMTYFCIILPDIVDGL